MRRNRTHYFQQEKKDQQNDMNDQENEDREGVFAYDKYCQKKIWDHFDYDEYRKTQTTRFKKQQTQKLCTTLKLGEYRETQNVDLRIAGKLKANMHILLSISNHTTHNANTLNGKDFIPKNQIRYYWTSLLEYCQMLRGYEKGEVSSKGVAENDVSFYNKGIGNVDDTFIPWSVVREMESRIPDKLKDIELFLSH